MNVLAAQLPIIHLELPPEILVLGVITGLTYALLGIGLTLSYQTSRVLNFAHGEMGALAAALIPALVMNYRRNYWLAFGLALAVAAATGAFMELVLMRKLARSSRLVALVATIGAAQLFFAINTFLPKGSDLVSATFPTPFQADVTIGSLHLGAGQLLILTIVPVIAGGLTVFFRFTRQGIASRAAAENWDAARLAGIKVRRVSLTMWVLAGVLAGLSAILLGPTQPVSHQASLGPSLMLRGLGAAMLGGLSSLPRVFAGGLAIGIVEIVVSWNYPTGGAVDIVLVALIVGSLVVQRGLGQLARGGEDSSWSFAGTVSALPSRIRHLPRVRAWRTAGIAALVIIAIASPLWLNTSQTVLLSGTALFALIGLSLTVLTGMAGQVSLGQFAFVAVGALVGGRMHQLGYPPFMGALYAVCAGGLLALVVGLPALRVRGLFLAVTTLGFAVVTPTWLFRQSWLVHESPGGGTSAFLPRPSWIGIDFASERNYYYLCLVALVAVAAAVNRLRNTGVGRAIMAVRDNEPAAASLGVPRRRVKLLAFVIAGMIAALGGYLYGGLLVSFTDPTRFGPELSLALVGMVVLGGATTVTGAVLGAIWLRGSLYLLAPLIPSIAGPRLSVILGGVGLLAAVLSFPDGVAAVVFALRDRLVARVSGVSVREPDNKPAQRRPLPPAVVAGPPTVPEGPTSSAPALEAQDVSIRFGGNRVLENVSLHANPGEIIALIGPNGAGKTTLFEILSGHLRPDEGSILLHGRTVTGWRPEQRARLGLGRSFQQARLFQEMPLEEALKVALELEEPSEVVPSLLGLPPSRIAEQRKHLRIGELLELFGLQAFAATRVGELSTGMRRFAELSAIVAMGADVLLLDEPTAGIAQREVEAFQPVLREIRDHLGATIVIIEHDIPMILQLADRVYALASGAVIAEGPPEHIRTDERVIAAYLGSDERVIQRSGHAGTVLSQGPST